MRDTTHLFHDCSCEYFASRSTPLVPKLCDFDLLFYRFLKITPFITRPRYPEKYLACSAGAKLFGISQAGMKVLA